MVMVVTSWRWLSLFEKDSEKKKEEERKREMK